MHLLIKQDIPFGYGQHLPQLWQLQLSMDLAPAKPKAGVIHIIRLHKGGGACLADMAVRR